MFNIESRRYVGNKFKLNKWIKSNIKSECINCNSFLDLFAGTGSVSAYNLDAYDTLILNDFLYSNEVIYKAFFENLRYNFDKLINIKEKYNQLDTKLLEDNYVSINFSNNFFSRNDALKIGYIRENINCLKKEGFVNEKEFNILLASLVYSLDRISNTCGHYDAYIKTENIKSCFKFELIKPLETKDKIIKIFRENANELVEKIESDIVFIDPPYNSRQYSRFYHLLENIVKWEKPKLYGIALKPEPENMSEYCKTKAPIVFGDLISKIKAKYIVVTYNNTYNSKSSSSKNKITLEEIKQILEEKGNTKIYEKDYKFFNAGKTNFEGHKEILFITKVNNDEN